MAGRLGRACAIRCVRATRDSGRTCPYRAAGEPAAPLAAAAGALDCRTHGTARATAQRGDGGVGGACGSRRRRGPPGERGAAGIACSHGLGPRRGTRANQSAQCAARTPSGSAGKTRVHRGAAAGGAGQVVGKGRRMAEIEVAASPAARRAAIARREGLGARSGNGARFLSRGGVRGRLGERHCVVAELSVRW